MAAAKSDPLKISNPALAPGSLVLVTGANGYIGSHAADQLLGLGYRVRAAVRSSERAKWMKDLFAPYGEGNLEFFEVPDMTKDGAFDEAVKGTGPTTIPWTPGMLIEDDRHIRFHSRSFAGRFCGRSKQDRSGRN